MKKYTIAVVGALGNVGTEIRDILEKSELTVGNLVLMDIAQNTGKIVRWRETDCAVIEAKPEACK